MNSTSLLDDIIAILSEKLDNVRFVRAYSSEWGSRRPGTPVVTGEIESEELKEGREQVKLKFLIFLPESAGARAAEKIFYEMCLCVGDKYPGFSAVTRGSAKRDSDSGLLSVECAMTFIESDNGATIRGRTIMLGGKQYSVRAVTVKMVQNGKELVSVGETVPFAVLGNEPEYTVELTGIETAGLEKLANFTATTDSGITYRGCRWKNICASASTAVFVSSERVGCD